MVNFAYLRVSTDHQDVANQKFGILEYCNYQKITSIQMIEDSVSGKKHWKNRAIGDLLTKADKNDVIVVSEISRLGRSTLQVLEILELAVRKRICIHIVKNQMIMDGSMQSTITATVLGLAAQIEREFISVRTKEALAKRKSDGVQLGRPKGPAASLKLDEREEEIVGYLKKSISKRAIAKLTDCAPSTLYKWMKRRKIDKKALQPV